MKRTITSNVLTSGCNKTKWNITIKSDNDLSEEDKGFIQNYASSIYHNDITCKLWMFDTKLPSGRWLENISLNNELTVAKALVM
mgnify:CR=1 FL=1